METKLTIKDAPVVTYADPTEAHEAKRLMEGECNMLGAVVVGGNYNADCFRYKEIQAGVPNPKGEFDEDGDYDEPKAPW